MSEQPVGGASPPGPMIFLKKPIPVIVLSPVPDQLVFGALAEAYDADTAYLRGPFGRMQVQRSAVRPIDEFPDRWFCHPVPPRMQ